LYFSFVETAWSVTARTRYCLSGPGPNIAVRNEHDQKKGTDRVTLAGACRKVQSTKSIRDIAIVWNSRVFLEKEITAQRRLADAIIDPCCLARKSFLFYDPQI
jgi:hypothetical protein